MLFALATNVGIKHFADRECGETEAVVRRVRRPYVNRDNLRRALRRLVNATMAARTRLVGPRHDVRVGLLAAPPA